MKIEEKENQSEEMATETAEAIMSVVEKTIDIKTASSEVIAETIKQVTEKVMSELEKLAKPDLVEKVNALSRQGITQQEFISEGEDILNEIKNGELSSSLADVITELEAKVLLVKDNIENNRQLNPKDIENSTKAIIEALKETALAKEKVGGGIKTQEVVVKIDTTQAGQGTPITPSVTPSTEQGVVSNSTTIEDIMKEDKFKAYIVKQKKTSIVTEHGKRELAKKVLELRTKNK